METIQKNPGSPVFSLPPTLDKITHEKRDEAENSPIFMKVWCREFRGHRNDGSKSCLQSYQITRPVFYFLLEIWLPTGILRIKMAGITFGESGTENFVAGSQDYRTGGFGINRGRWDPVSTMDPPHNDPCHSPHSR